MTLHLPDLSSDQKEIVSSLQGYEELPLVSLTHAIQPLLSIVPGIEQMLEIIEQKCNQPIDHLSLDESRSIMLYTLKWKTAQSSLCFILNEMLRLQVRETIRPWFLYLRLFICALSKLPSVPFHTVYRGLNNDKTTEYHKGEDLIWWEFTSCKSSIELAEQSINENEVRTIFIIDCDAAKDISKHSDDKNEIILYPARQFEVISSLNCGNQLNLIQLREKQPQYPLIVISPMILMDNSTKLTTKSTSNNAHPTNHLELMINQYQHYSKINLFRQQLTDIDMYIVTKCAIINKQCKSLFLSENIISSMGASIIAETLNNNKTLENLSLSYNCLGDEGVQSLTNILSRNNCNLNTLSLHSTGITDEGIKYVSEMLKTNTTLTWLYLGDNKISDEGVKLLADVLIHQNTTLKVLALSKNKLITDGSIDFLTEIFQQNNSLETLWINECKLSSVGKKKLQEIGQLNKRLFVLVI